VERLPASSVPIQLATAALLPHLEGDRAFLFFIADDGASNVA
jgi:hypothetical protein